MFNFCSKLRYFSNLSADLVNKVPKHPLRKLWKKQDVFSCIAQSVLYNDGDIVAFNKPSGVAKTRTDEDPIQNPTIFFDDFIKDSFPKLFPHFKEPVIVKFPEKYSSGVLIVAANEEIAHKIAKCKRRAKENPEYFDKSLVLSEGRPVVREDSLKLAVKLDRHKSSKKRVRVLVDEWSKAEMKRNEVAIFRIAHKVISEGDLACLSSVSLSSSRNNALRLYFAMKLLSPIIGDIQFSSRVKNIMGVPMLIDHFSDVANSPKNLPKELLRALLLNSNETPLVPHLVHLAEVSLPRYSYGRDLILKAPVPETFSWICRLLGVYDDGLVNFGKGEEDNKIQIKM